MSSSNSNSPTSNNKKSKKLLDLIDKSKPQSQINKCLNEKRRREQENIYIEELAELISASIQDMSSLSVKPDKCAILQETVNQIRRIKAAEELAVQQGEVSSSTNILANEILCPLVLEALDGFLFVVNTQGTVEFCSENVLSFIQYTPGELLGKSIYDVVHLSDHARFSSSLLPMSIGWTNRGGNSKSPQPSTSSAVVETEQPPSNKQRSFNIRVRVNPQTGNESNEQSENQAYENMQITAMLMPHPVAASVGGAEPGTPTPPGQNKNCLVCIARRLPPNERPPGSPVEQFTTKLSTDGGVIGVDTSGLSVKWARIVRKDTILTTPKKTLLQELCHVHDVPKLDSHLRETLQNGSSTSLLYRLKVNPEKHVQVQTKSKFFTFNDNSSADFIMATHTIIQAQTNEEPSQNELEEFVDYESLIEMEKSPNMLLPQQQNYSNENSPMLLNNWLNSPQQQQQQQNYSNEMIEELLQPSNPGDRLRNLLTLNSMNNTVMKSDNKILKGLLNQDDEDNNKDNNMLLKLLNDNKLTNENKGNELLQQLLSNSNENSNNSLKRPLPDSFMLQQQQSPAAKYQNVGPPAPGELCKRNPRLVSLLAKQPEQMSQIPQVPSNYISGTPQEKLFINQKKFQQNIQKYSSNHGNNHNKVVVVEENNADAILDEILDQVIDIVPDNNQVLLPVYSDDVSNILNMLESNTVPDPEVAKINAIQKELMQFEQSQPYYNVANSNNSSVGSPTVQQQPASPASPVYIHRTTTTTTTSITARYNQQQQLLQQQQQQRTTPVHSPNSNQLSPGIVAPPNQVAPIQNQQQHSLLLKQQLLNQQKQRALLMLQQQQQNQQIPQQQQQMTRDQQQVQLIRELQMQIRLQNQQQQQQVQQQQQNNNVVVGGVSLDSLLLQQQQQNQLLPPQQQLINQNSLQTQQLLQQQQQQNLLQGSNQQNILQGNQLLQNNLLQQQNVILNQQLVHQFPVQQQQQQQMVRQLVTTNSGTTNPQQQQQQQQQQLLLQQQRQNQQNQQQLRWNQLLLKQQQQQQQNPVVVSNNNIIRTSSSSQQLSNPMLNAQLNSNSISSNNPSNNVVVQQGQQQIQQQQNRVLFVPNSNNNNNVVLNQFNNQQQNQQQQFRIVNRQPINIQQQQQIGQQQQVVLQQQQNNNNLVYSTTTNQQLQPNNNQQNNYVDIRQELRAIVGARQQLQQQQQQLGGSVVTATTANSAGVPDLEALGFGVVAAAAPPPDSSSNPLGD